MGPSHRPVLTAEILQILSPRPGERVLDCTLGLGGHAAQFLDAIGPDGVLIGLDADSVNLGEARNRLASYCACSPQPNRAERARTTERDVCSDMCVRALNGETAGCDRVELHHANFRDAVSVVTRPVDVVFADLGVSSPHLDDPERGFTFRASGPLDLRYDRSSGASAAEFLLTASEEQIMGALQEFGEIQRSRQLAAALRTHFHSEQRPLDEWKTDDVVQCVERIFTWRAPSVLPQVFQALRIAVNDELGALRSLLEALPRITAPGGRSGIISYHSLEDRMVKQTFRTLATPQIDDRTGQVSVPAAWELLTRKAITPSAQEIAENPRSRSAKFRAIRRLP